MKYAPKFAIGDKVRFSVPESCRTNAPHPYEGRVYTIVSLSSTGNGIGDEFPTYCIVPIEKRAEDWEPPFCLEDYLVPCP